MALVALHLGLSVLLLALLGHVSGQRVGFERTSDFPVSECPKRYSCGRDNKPPWTAEKLQGLNCYCDDLCETYDDCCDDHVSKLYPTNAFQLPAEVFACKNLGPQYDLGTGDARLQRFYVVDLCPARYSDECVRGKCELRGAAAAESFNRLPVHGRTSRILYQNYFCALCNGDEDVVFWSGRIDFSEVKYLEAQGKPSLSQTSTRFFSVEDYELRPCKTVVRHCCTGWTNDEVKKRCVNRAQSNAYLYVYTTNLSIYRNTDCASCNHVTNARAGCFVVSGVPPPQPSQFPEQHHSVRVIFNVSARIVTTIKTIDHRKRSETVEYFRCNQNAIYDPFTKQCRDVFCTSNGSVTPLPTIQSSDSVTPLTTNQSSDSVTPLPKKQSSDSVTPLPTKQSSDSVTPLPKKQSSDSVTPSDDGPPPYKPPKCDRWYVFDRSAKVCRPVLNGFPCPKGYKLIPDGCILAKDESIDDKPLPDKSPKCDRWYVYDRSVNMCRIVASCKAGYRLTDDGCVPKQPERKSRCPRWFIYDPDTDDCRLVENCPAGYVMMGNGCERRE